MGGLLALGSALKGDGGGTACQDAGDLDAVFDRAALVGDRLAGATGGGVELGEGVVIEPMPDQCRGGFVGATAPSTTRASVHTPFASSVTLTPTPTTAMSISVRGMKRR